jgi:hypothetical protein
VTHHLHLGDHHLPTPPHHHQYLLLLLLHVVVVVLGALLLMPLLVLLLLLLGMQAGAQAVQGLGQRQQLVLLDVVSHQQLSPLVGRHWVTQQDQTCPAWRHCLTLLVVRQVWHHPLLLLLCLVLLLVVLRQELLLLLLQQLRSLLLPLPPPASAPASVWPPWV